MTYNELMSIITNSTFGGQVDLFKKGRCICRATKGRLRLHLNPGEDCLYLYCNNCSHRKEIEGAKRELTTQEYFVINCL